MFLVVLKGKFHEMNIFESLKNFYVLSVNVLMDVTIPKMMFKNKLLKLPSKIPSLNLPFINTSFATGWFLKSSPLIGCRKTTVVKMY